MEIWALDGLLNPLDVRCLLTQSGRPGNDLMRSRWELDPGGRGLVECASLILARFFFSF